jgi:hypothetical protein
MTEELEFLSEENIAARRSLDVLVGLAMASAHTDKVVESIDKMQEAVLNALSKGFDTMKMEGDNSQC